MAKEPKWFKWVVEVQVDRTWVEDGFDLDNERAKHMLNAELPHALGHEIKARVLQAPPVVAVRRAQGYLASSLKSARAVRRD